MQERDDLIKRHKENEKKQYAQEAMALLAKINPHLISINQFQMAFDGLKSTEAQISLQSDFVARQHLFAEHTRWLTKCHEGYQAAKIAHGILANEPRSIIFTMNEELANAKIQIEQVLATENEINEGDALNKAFNDEISSVKSIEAISLNLSELFKQIAQFKKKDFYDNFNNIEYIENFVGMYAIKLMICKKKLSYLILRTVIIFYRNLILPKKNLVYYQIA